MMINYSKQLIKVENSVGSMENAFENYDKFTDSKADMQNIIKAGGSTTNGSSLFAKIYFK